MTAAKLDACAACAQVMGWIEQGRTAAEVVADVRTWDDRALMELFGRLAFALEDAALPEPLRRDFANVQLAIGNEARRRKVVA